ncbi:hypothetical protein EK21DRAFT_92952 [Setomelanomma holmii]|uniref:Uncharacterized protein n=1 Tax=Setomelanomma holmii TaxID=210430 RepID=A0A9P4H0U2_9PLEO|nr:hypothetical protein EK21DRAFT_92952 [Setomelanomma holmii]
MSRSTPRSQLPRRSPRTSLHHIGIPDAHDALAIYLRWVRAARYYRAEAEMRDVEIASSTHPVVESHRRQRVEVPVGVEFDGKTLAYDLTCPYPMLPCCGRATSVALW